MAHHVPYCSSRQFGLVAVFASCLGVAVAASAPGWNQTFDEAEAIRYAQLARATFCNPEKIGAWECGEACDAVEVVTGAVKPLGPTKDWGVQAFVAELPLGPTKYLEISSKHCVIAVRGSVSFSNWEADFDFPGAPFPPEGADWCPGCEVATGFIKAYEEVKPLIDSAVSDLGCTHVAWTGHSFGAGIVYLGSLEMRSRGHIVVDPVYMLGAPRIANAATRDAYMALTASSKVPAWRVVHYHDPVPRMIAVNGVIPRVHLPHEVYYNKAFSHYRECQDTEGDEDPTCSDATPLWRCVNFEHLHYFNLSFAHSFMSAQCKRPLGGAPQKQDSLVYS